MFSNNKIEMRLLDKFIAVFVSVSLVISLSPNFAAQQVAFAEENESDADLSGEVEITDETVQGRIKSVEEVSEQAESGGHFDMVDRTDVNYNVKESDSLEEASLSASLPSKVDLRSTANRVTSVKNQERTGTCWAWAALSASETSIAKSSGKSAKDLSAFQTAYFGWTALPTSTSQLKGTEVSQAGEGTKVPVGRTLLSVGGSTAQVPSMLMQGIGVTTASDIAFPASALKTGYVPAGSNLSIAQRRHSVARLSKWNYLGSLINTSNSSYVSTNKTVLNRIKTQLSKGLAVEIGCYSESSTTNYISTKTYAQYVNTYIQSNHSVCVVGYDDNYSKTNFVSGKQPPANGAFIVKNSWGTDWGNSGYFYLSYYDQTIDYASTYEFDTSTYTGSLIDTNTEVVDQYDYLQSGSVAYKEAQWYSNIYTASQKQQLHHIGTYYGSEGGTLTYKVYRLKDNATSPKDVLYSLDEPDAQGTFTASYEGYASIKLSTPVNLKKGQKYAIWISQKRGGKYYAPVATSYLTMGKTIVNDGESFCSNTPSTSWTKQTGTTYAGNAIDNFCVKGYATVLTNTSKVTFNSNGGTSVATQTVKDGNKATKPANPTKSGYIFAGWYSDKNLTSAYNFSTSVQVDITLYAKWIKKVTMHRLYNKWTGEHFYTSNTSEKNNLVNKGWTYEGVGWNAPSSSKTPVYRLYNKYVSGGDHHYTTSATERDTLKKAGWTYEGVGWYSDDSKAVPLYRQYNRFASTGTHNYTTSKSENDNLVKKGWRAEGIAWYGLK